MGRCSIWWYQVLSLILLVPHKECFVVHVCCHWASGCNDCFFSSGKGSIQVSQNDSPFLVKPVPLGSLCLVSRGGAAAEMISVHRFSVAHVGKNRTLARDWQTFCKHMRLCGSESPCGLCCYLSLLLKGSSCYWWCPNGKSITVFQSKDCDLNLHVVTMCDEIGVFFWLFPTI